MPRPPPHRTNPKEAYVMFSKNKDKHKSHENAAQPRGKPRPPPRRPTAIPPLQTPVPAPEPAAEPPSRPKPPPKPKSSRRLKDRYARLMADFDNFRKRQIREREELIKRANEELLGDLLPGRRPPRARSRQKRSIPPTRLRRGENGLRPVPCPARPLRAEPRSTRRASPLIPLFTKPSPR